MLGARVRASNRIANIFSTPLPHRKDSLFALLYAIELMFGWNVGTVLCAKGVMREMKRGDRPAGFVGIFACENRAPICNSDFFCG